MLGEKIKLQDLKTKGKKDPKIPEREGYLKTLSTLEHFYPS